jgi:gas vesicle protein
METPVNRLHKDEDLREIAERLHAALSTVVANGKAPEPEAKASVKPAETKDDHQIPAFWRICGATLVSVAAMVAVTLYIQLSNQVGSLRGDLNALRDQNHDLVRTDDYNSRNLAIAATIKEVQASNAAAMEFWKERTLSLERQINALQEENKRTVRELDREVQKLRERLAVLENKQGGEALKPKGGLPTR